MSGATLGCALTLVSDYQQKPSQDRRLIACSLAPDDNEYSYGGGGNFSNKRAYLSDFEAWGTTGYLKPWNVFAKLLLIAMDPCAKTLQEISVYIQEIDEQEQRGIVTLDDEISFEKEWANRWERTLAGIKSNAIKTISIDFLRKTFEHIALASCSTRTTDRLTKLVDKSCARKLARYGDRLFLDRPRVALKMLKTTAWGLALGRLAAFSFEMVSVNVFLWQEMGSKHYLRPTKHKFQKMFKWTLKRASYYTLQWVVYSACVSICGAGLGLLDRGWLGRGAGCNLGYVLGDTITDAIAGLFEDFLVDGDDNSADLKKVGKLTL